MQAPEPGGSLLLMLFLMLVSAKLMAELFERLKQPAVVGEILAGVLIGPELLGWVQPSDTSHVLSEIGVIFLLFSVGLETKPADILRVGRTAAVVAVLGVAVPFAGGWACMKLAGGNAIESLFVGTALVATSVGITARVLAEMKLLDAPTARIILGAAVIDDILGLLVLAGVASAASGDLRIWRIAGTGLAAVTFVGLVAFMGSRAATRAAPHVGQLRLSNAAFALSVAICLGLAVAAEIIGVAAIIGAFLAGLMLAEAAHGKHDLHEQTKGVTEFLVPFFLVNIGMQLKLSALAQPDVMRLALGLTLIAVLTKFAGCGLGALQLGWRGAAQVGAGMVPRGEVGIVVAQIGLGLGVIDDRLFAVVLFVAVATTLVAPPLLRKLFLPTPGH